MDSEYEQLEFTFMGDLSSHYSQPKPIDNESEEDSPIIPESDESEHEPPSPDESFEQMVRRKQKNIWESGE